jgi:hypothetical protein
MPVSPRPARPTIDAALQQEDNEDGRVRVRTKHALGHFPAFFVSDGLGVTASPKRLRTRSSSRSDMSSNDSNTSETLGAMMGPSAVAVTVGAEVVAGSAILLVGVFSGERNWIAIAEAELTAERALGRELGESWEKV